jgi:hypothetical protein
MSAAVTLRCEPSGALAPLGEPRRVAADEYKTSFEARRKGDAHLQDERIRVRSGMTSTLLDE